MGNCFGSNKDEAFTPLLSGSQISEQIKILQNHSIQRMQKIKNTSTEYLTCQSMIVDLEERVLFVSKKTIPSIKANKSAIQKVTNTMNGIRKDIEKLSNKLGLLKEKTLNVSSNTVCDDISDISLMEKNVQDIKRQVSGINRILETLESIAI